MSRGASPPAPGPSVTCLPSPLKLGSSSPKNAAADAARTAVVPAAAKPAEPKILLRMGSSVHRPLRGYQPRGSVRGRTYGGRVASAEPARAFVADPYDYGEA